MKAIGMAAACIAACSAPAILAIAGPASLGLTPETGLLVSAIALVIAAAFAIQARRQPAPACHIDGSCGCKKQDKSNEQHSPSHG